MSELGMPNGVTARLGRYGYAVSDTLTGSRARTALLSRMVERITALPGVSSDPETRKAIAGILEGFNSDD